MASSKEQPQQPEKPQTSQSLLGLEDTPLRMEKYPHRGNDRADFREFMRLDPTEPTEAGLRAGLPRGLAWALEMDGQQQQFLFLGKHDRRRLLAAAQLAQAGDSGVARRQALRAATGEREERLDLNAGRGFFSRVFSRKQSPDEEPAG